MQDQVILEAFPFLQTVDNTFKQRLLNQSRSVTIPAGHIICSEEATCVHLPLVISGEARVFKVSGEGKELTLYRISKGESCILTASCIINDVVFPANAIAETEMNVLTVSAIHVQEWLKDYQGWRTYLFSLLANRLAEVVELVEEVAFQRMDYRLASYLNEASQETGYLKKTHERIASDLGTSREVISRLLKTFEHKGLVSLERGAVIVRDQDALARYR